MDKEVYVTSKLDKRALISKEDDNIEVVYKMGRTFYTHAMAIADRRGYSPRALLELVTEQMMACYEVGRLENE